MMGFMVPIRRLAVSHLNVGQGSFVMDIGCGSGASFPYLIEAVGNQGSILAIDISPSMIEQARKRKSANHWHNIAIHETSVEDFADQGSYDAALLFAMHDVFTSQAAVQKIHSLLKPGGRIVCVGPKLVKGFPKSLANLLIAAVFRRFAVSQQDRDCPWRRVEKHFETKEIIKLMNGVLFIYIGEKAQLKSG